MIRTQTINSFFKRHLILYFSYLFFIFGTNFSGKLELELEIPSDLTDAKCLSQSYPKLTSWTSFIESISTSDLERGFLQNPIVETEEEDEEEQKVIGEATQNMALALEVSVTIDQKIKKVYFISRVILA